MRARIAAASKNFTRPDGTLITGSKWHLAQGQNYYPIADGSKARLCNSCFSNQKSSLGKTFEGTIYCHANTPVGQAIGCPESLKRTSPAELDECHWNSSTCHMVYMGHNLLGAEMHWLPYKYLSSWWEQQQLTASTIPWHRLDPNQIWCDSQNSSRPKHHTQKEPMDSYEYCSIPLS